MISGWGRKFDRSNINILVKLTKTTNTVKLI